jgi:beta-lactamase regulating signal transducer with metallopeptidase domain
MPVILIVILKINFVLLLFTAAYYALLRRFTFYNLNRAFLIFGILFSSLYPFIDLSGLFNRHQQKMPQLKEVVTQIQSVKISPQPLVNFWSIMMAVMIIGALALAVRLIIQLWSLYQIHSQATSAKCNDIHIKKLEGNVSPFSFWRNIYINPSLYTPSELENILKHEQIHVKELHTLDILIAELSTIFYWFNPGVWLMKKAIKENIEFITDAEILNAGANKKNYQYSLLTVNNLQLKSNLVNSFNFSDIKTRIKMMNKGKSKKSSVLIYAFIFPVILVICLIFTISKAKESVAFKQFKTIQTKVQLLKKSDIKSSVSLQKEVKTSVASVKQEKEQAPVIIEQSEIKLIKYDSDPSDTSFYSPQILLDKIDQITNAVKSNLDPSVKVNFTRIKIDKSAKIDTNKIKKVLVLSLKDSPEINLKDSTKVVYYLNGEVVNKDRVSNYDPKQIKSITIIKNNKMEGTGIRIETN